MDTRSIASRRRPPQGRRPRLPRLPGTLLAREVAYRKRFGRPWYDGPSYADAPPLLPEDLTAAACEQLRQRAETRRRRLRSCEGQAARDWFWLAAELALVLPRLRPRSAVRWREVIHAQIWHAEFELKQLRKLEALVLGHEPETDAWLRRQLAPLDPGTSA